MMTCNECEVMACNECEGAPLCTDADPVQRPSHYMLEGLDIEAIDVIRSVLGDGFGAYCRGNVLKYLIRADHKGRRAEDLRKAAKYIEWEIEAREEEG